MNPLNFLCVRQTTPEPFSGRRQIILLSEGSAIKEMLFIRPDHLILLLYGLVVMLTCPLYVLLEVRLSMGIPNSQQHPIHPLWPHLLVVTMVWLIRVRTCSWRQARDFDLACERRSSLNLHVKTVQFCKMSWESDGSPSCSRLLRQRGRRVIEVLNHTVSLKRCHRKVLSHVSLQTGGLNHRANRPFYVKALDMEPFTVGSVHPFVSVILSSIYFICFFYYHISIE